MSNPNLGNSEVIYRLDVLINKAAGDKRVTENGFLKKYLLFSFLQT